MKAVYTTLYPSGIRSIFFSTSLHLQSDRVAVAARQQLTSIRGVKMRVCAAKSGTPERTLTVTDPTRIDQLQSGQRSERFVNAGRSLT